MSAEDNLRDRLDRLTTEALLRLLEAGDPADPVLTEVLRRADQLYLSWGWEFTPQWPFHPKTRRP